MAGTTTYYGISYPTSTDYVKDGATAMQTIATGFDTAVAIPTYNNQTGTSYTFVLADTGKTVTSDNASAVTFTIPPQSSVAWAANTTLTVRNLGAGVVTIAGGAGVTVTNTAQTVAQYGAIRIIRTASNAWTVVPASGGSSGLTLVGATNYTSSTSVNINNCFSNTYDNYRIVISNTACTSAGGANIEWRSRNGGTDDSSAVYSWCGMERGVSFGSYNATNVSYGFIGRGAITSGWGQSTFDVIQPFMAEYTTILGQTAGVSGTDDTLVVIQTMRRVASSHDGITFLFGNASTGTVFVYGYQK